MDALRLHLFKSRRQRGVKPPPEKEFALQVSIAAILRNHCRPDWRTTHFPAGDKRDAITGARLKAQGLVPGWPDFVLLGPRGAHFLELKREGARLALSDAQQAFADFCNANGYPHAVIDSIGAAIAVLGHWGTCNIKVSA